jgi:hypothetical protein
MLPQPAAGGLTQINRCRLPAKSRWRVAAEVEAKQPISVWIDPKVGDQSRTNVLLRKTGEGRFEIAVGFGIHNSE